jgi:hypothetical protein
MAKSKIEFETFLPLSGYARNNMTVSEPSSFNGNCRFRKYRVTVEEIEEPKEVLAARLQKLWDECKNSHQWDCISDAAGEIGYKLKGRAGKKAK